MIVEATFKTKGTNLIALGYDPASKTLACAFNSPTGTRLYNGKGVPVTVYGELLAADADPGDSAGKAYNRVVRDKFTMTEVQLPEEE